MKRIVTFIFFALAISWASSIALAEVPKNPGSEVINLKMGNMSLPFNHWKHQASVKNDCYSCHKSKIGQIDGWGESSAHKICIPCHDLESKGPVLCQECHVKSEKLQLKGADLPK